MKDCFSKTAILIALLAAAVFAGAAQAAQPDPDRYIVSFLDSAKGRSALKATGASVLRELPNQGAVAAHIPARALKGLMRNPSIEYIEVDALRYPMSQTVPWGIPTIQADRFTDPNSGLSADTTNTMVCIIDSGYSNGHEDLPVLDSSDTSPDPGTDPALGAASYCHHGTHVAGTIAALDNSVGVVGVNPTGDVLLHIVKVFKDDPNSDSGCSWGYSSDLVGALDACMTAKGAGQQLVINMSLGGSIKSRTEQRAFASAYNAGVLSVAAAGNDGSNRSSYPASYDSVISVAAVDSSLAVADFSQQNSQVELAAPGVAVRSTVTMEFGFDESLIIGGSSFDAIGMEGSPNSSATGDLFLCAGLGSPGDCAGAAGKVCLIARGDISFADKALECSAQGGVGAVIFNNADALFSGTFAGVDVPIPTVGLSGLDGADLESHYLDQSATVTTGPGNYAYYDGTSMATPHVAGAAALVWSQDLTCSNADIRNALDSTAVDLGAAGRDNAYGFGLVQAASATAALNCGGGGGGGGGGSCDLGQIGDTCNVDSDCCSSTCKGKPGAKTCK